MPLQQRSLLSAVTDNLFSTDFVGALSALLLLLLIVGIVVWLAERRRNPEQFGGDTAAGIGSGLWWAAVTMTTVGYGDKAPATPLGRTVGLVRNYQGELRVLPGTFARQDYAIALPTNSPLREEINRVLLEKLGSREWNDIRYRYLGD